MKILAALILAGILCLPAYAGDASAKSANRSGSFKLSNGSTLYWLIDENGLHKTILPRPTTAAQVIYEAKLKERLAKASGKKTMEKRYVPWSAAQGGLNYGSSERRGSSSFENSPYPTYGIPRH